MTDLRILLSSLVLKYLSSETFFSSRSIILTVVSNPTSEEMRMPSNSSRNDSSTVDLPATALATVSYTHLTLPTKRIV